MKGAAFRERPSDGFEILIWRKRVQFDQMFPQSIELRICHFALQGFVGEGVHGVTDGLYGCFMSVSLRFRGKVGA